VRILPRQLINLGEGAPQLMQRTLLQERRRLKVLELDHSFQAILE
jgi:hypothetical protein